MTIEQPWRQMAGEPEVWFSRFKLYCLAGPGRSVAEVFDEERLWLTRPRYPWRTPRVSVYWQRAAQRWQWEARAAAWDVAEAERVRLEARQTRREVLQVIGNQVKAALDRLQPETMTLPELVPLVRLLEEQLRAEYEGPAAGKEQTVQPKPILIPYNGRGDQ